MNQRTKRLLELKAQHKLTYKCIARHTFVQPSTALHWLMKEGPRAIPQRKLEKLEIKLNGVFVPFDEVK